MKALLQQALDALEGIPTSFGNVAYTAQVTSAIEALRAAIAQPESEPVANLRRWMSGPELGAPERVIYAVKVLDDGRALPMGSYDMYLQPSAAPQVADYVPLSDEQIDLCMRLPVGCESWSSAQRSRFMARAIERAVRGVK